MSKKIRMVIFQNTQNTIIYTHISELLVLVSDGCSRGGEIAQRTARRKTLTQQQGQQSRNRRQNHLSA